MKARTVAILLAFATLAYVLIAGYQALVLIRSGSVSAAIMGVGLLVLPLVGLLLVWREVTFGFHVQAMARSMNEQGYAHFPEPAADSPLADIDAAFQAEKVRTEEDPTDWRAWYRLAAAYDAARDKRRARAAMRYAYSLYSDAER